VLFNDWETAKRILATSKPPDQKKLGRKVRNFDEEVWRQHRFQIVKDGNTAKFVQNSPLKKKLLTTAGSTLVEASPHDRLWGIGLSAEDNLAQNRETWRGMNLLGQALTEVRDEIIKAAEAGTENKSKDSVEESDVQGDAKRKKSKSKEECHGQGDAKKET
jgi:ribA/ribD-fused uncharacterized protein